MKINEKIDLPESQRKSARYNYVHISNNLERKPKIKKYFYIINIVQSGGQTARVCHPFAACQYLQVKKKLLMSGQRWKS
jgi:hypothetical protein